MIIQSSNMNLGSTRSYRERTYTSSSVSMFTSNTGISVTEDERSQSGSSKNFTDLVNQYEAAKNVRYQTLHERTDALEQLRKEMMNYLLRLIFGDQADHVLSDSAPSEAAVTDTYTFQTIRHETRFVYQEDETTSFSTSGVVHTADGKTIDIHLDLIMSRSFREATSEIIDYTQPVMCDPLVINLNVPSAAVSDQTFLFDLDADGTQEEISMLDANSGYLAFDQNGDGIINDGSELFGTKSGNGFADLSAYDEDKNGWIDENDAIFSKLKIWCMDANGNSTLVNLKESGVGAIYLGNSDTNFSIKSAENTTNAVIRKTGLFLYENGAAGTIQQLDLATYRATS